MPRGKRKSNEKQSEKKQKQKEQKKKKKNNLYQELNLAHPGHRDYSLPLLHRVILYSLEKKTIFKAFSMELLPANTV